MIPRVPPKGAGEVRYTVLSCCYFAANSYCGNTSSVFFIALGGDEKSTFPKGEGFGSVHIYESQPPIGRLALFLQGSLLMRING